MGKSKPKNWATGRWLIESMDQWGKKYTDVEVPGYFDFADNNLGSFHFGYVQGDLDYRLSQRDGKPVVEFSFEGGDGADGSPCSGRGWMALDDDDTLVGMLFFHCGDESGIELSRAEEKPKRKRN